MKIAIISFTQRGDQVNKRIGSLRTGDVIVQSFYGERAITKPTFSLREWTKTQFETVDAILYVGAAGIAVRAIAPFVTSKDQDPAVLVIDECSRFVIPILSGHIGGANNFANELAGKLQATPVVTTATDLNHVFAVDTFAVARGFAIEPVGEIKHISGALLAGEDVAVKSPVYEGLEALFAPQKVPEHLIWEPEEFVKNGISVSPFRGEPFEHTLHLIPKCIVLGVGSKKGVDERTLIEFADKKLNELNIFPSAVKCIATIDLKQEEKAVLALSKHLSVPLICYSADELNEVEGEFASSDFVKRVTGTDNVCERSVLRAMKKGKILLSKTAGDGVTLSIGCENLDIIR